MTRVQSRNSGQTAPCATSLVAVDVQSYANSCYHPILHPQRRMPTQVKEQITYPSKPATAGTEPIRLRGCVPSNPAYARTRLRYRASAYTPSKPAHAGRHPKRPCNLHSYVVQTALAVIFTRPSVLRPFRMPPALAATRSQLSARCPFSLVHSRNRASSHNC